MRTPISPRDVGVPHDTWQPNQLEAFDEVHNLHLAGGGKIFLEAPTGSGKTAVACALGSVAPTLYVAHSLALLDQAEARYGFSVVKGRQEYTCAHKEKVGRWALRYDQLPTAYDCHYANMRDCNYFSICEYHLARAQARRAQRAACTYQYLALSSAMQDRGGIVVLDECHASVEVLLHFAEFHINEVVRAKWGLPSFPYSEPYAGKGDILNIEARGKVEDWLHKAMLALTGYDPESEEGAKTKRLRDRLGQVLDQVQSENWFLECGRNIAVRAQRRRGRKTEYHIPGLSLRALSARSVASRLWKNKKTVLLMSATIGADPAPIAGELGIDSYEFVTYPHPVPVEYRPVYDLGVPRMTKRNLDKNSALFVIQAVAIARFIESLDPTWRGIVLAPSNYKVEMLRKHLGRILGSRMFTPPNGGPAQRIEAFLNDERPSLVLADTLQGLGHGIDLRGDLGRFVCVCGTDFPNPSDRFVQARRRVSGADKYLWARAYMGVPQACGRVSRGSRDENGEFLLNIAAIADGSCMTNRAIKHFPGWFLDAIRQEAP